MSGEEASEIVSAVLKGLQGSKLLSDVTQDIQKEIAKVNISPANLRGSVETFLQDTGWVVKLQNAVYQKMQELDPMVSSNIMISESHRKEPLAYISKAQASWEKRIVKSINSMCSDLALPLSRKRSSAEKKEFAGMFTTLESEYEDKDLDKIRPVYSPRDFLETLITVNDPNFRSLVKTSSSSKGWGCIKVQMHVKTVEEFIEMFSELDTSVSHCGVDDAPETGTDEVFDSEWTKLGKKVLKKGSITAARQYAKHGCPSSLRAQLWVQILGAQVDDFDRIYYEQLKDYVFQYEMLVDKLLFKDVRITGANDPNYFVFEDLLYQILLVFTRDTRVLKHFEHSCASPPKSYIRGKLGVPEYGVFYPPNGVIPFHGFSLYLAPVCYCFEQQVLLYHVFHKLYTTYFYKLHTISSDPQGILTLSGLFENLLQAVEPHLFYHLRQIGAYPLKLAFNWMFYAFSGYLEVDQILLLWDRILGYDSLELLAVLAVAIFVFRRDNLMGVTTLQMAEGVLHDISTLKVVPLLQNYYSKAKR